MGLDQGVPGSADRLRRRHDAADRRIHPDGDHVGSPLVASTSGLNADQRAAEVGRVRTALLAVLAGSIAVVGAIYTARTFALNRQTYEHARETTRQSHELDQARLVTERFTRAVDQLGNENLDVRLGGIYALERLARESRDDHGPIMEILTAYVREHAPQPTRAAKAPDERQEEPGGWVYAPARGASQRSSSRPRPPEHICPGCPHSLGRRRPNTTRISGLIYGTRYSQARTCRGESAEALLDGRTCTDRGWTGRSSTARASTADLHGADLGGAHLQEAYLKFAFLHGADLKARTCRGRTCRGRPPAPT